MFNPRKLILLRDSLSSELTRLNKEIEDAESKSLKNVLIEREQEALNLLIELQQLTSPESSAKGDIKDVISIRLDALDNLGGVDKRITIPVFNTSRSNALALRLELEAASHIGYVQINLSNGKVI